MDREIKTALHNILDLVNCAEDYGFQDDVLMTAFRDMTGWVTDEEIEAFVQGFMTPEMQAKGFGEEDAEAARTRVTEWRNRYCKREGRKE